jgi:hypothetical protein
MLSPPRSLGAWQYHSLLGSGRVAATGVDTLLVTFPPSLATSPLPRLISLPPPPPPPPRIVLPASGFGASAVGLTAPAALAVSVAALDLVLIKLGKNELLGEVGDAGVGSGDPVGERGTNGEVGRGMWVGRFVDVERDMVGREGSRFASPNRRDKAIPPREVDR